MSSARRWPRKVWARGFPVRDAEGKIRRLVGTALEITAQKQAEEEAEASFAESGAEQSHIQLPDDSLPAIVESSCRPTRMPWLDLPADQGPPQPYSSRDRHTSRPSDKRLWSSRLRLAYTLVSSAWQEHARPRLRTLNLGCRLLHSLSCQSYSKPNSLL